MQRFVAVLILLLVLLPDGVRGQHGALLTLDTTEVRNTVPSVMHVTDLLTNSPKGQAALQRFHERKAAGRLSRKASEAAEIGEIRTFFVLNFSLSFLGIPLPYPEPIDFMLVGADQHDPDRVGFRLWVEVAELHDEGITDSHISDLMDALAEQTPPRSFYPDSGVVAGIEAIFGDPPDVDADGISDVLWLDIRDEYDGGTNPVFVAGFVTPNDLDTLSGNGADILYLDTRPLLDFGIGFAAQTAAHEYQHLVMYNYDLAEYTFINEGLSEWAEIALGFAGRPITYLNAPETYNVPLYKWEGIRDYERAGLFMNYFANRFGVLETGRVTRNPASGSSGLAAVLDEISAGISVDDLVYDFHVANYLNDTTLGPAFGYTTGERQAIGAVPSRIFSGSAAVHTPAEEVKIQPGGVAYVEWRAVSDFKIRATVPLLMSRDVRVGLIRYDDQQRYVEILKVRVDGRDEVLVPGSSGRLVLVIVGMDPETKTVNVEYEASWSPSRSVAELVFVQYDDGNAVGHSDSGREAAFFQMAAGPDGLMATRFTPHVGASDDRRIHLDRVWVAPYWFSQFTQTNVPPYARRDFTIYVWSARDNMPDRILFQKNFEDPSSNAGSYSLRHLELDLSSEMQAIGELPDTMYIGIGELGTDPNRMIVGVSDYDVEDISLIGDRSDSTWVRLWDLAFQSGNTTATDHTVVPIRAQFILSPRQPVAVAEERMVPAGITLGQNYPNPFNPATTISFGLAEPVHVRLHVFDALGRQVVTLANRLMPAGRHEVLFRASSLASGVYYYRLEAGTASLTQRMLLLR